MSSSGPHTATIDELRRQRAVIDQAIALLEILNGNRPMPPRADSYTAVPDPAPTTKLLPPSPRRTATRRKPRPRASSSALPQPRRAHRPGPLREQLEADEAAVLAAVQKLKSATRADVVAATKLSDRRVTLAKHRLQKQGRLVVTGWAHASRWSLPGSAKEAP